MDEPSTIVDKEKIEDISKVDPDVIIAPEIVNATKKGFDRTALMKRLEENKKLVVTQKPVLKLLEEKTKPQEKTKLQEKTEKEKSFKPKTKPLNKKLSIIIEEDEGIEDTLAEKLQEKMKEKEEDIEEKEEIKIKVPRKKKLITELPKKGVAVLGAETVIEFKDKLPIKSPSVIIKAPNYYMNNREIFIHFINHIFQPYKDEIESNSDSISCDNIGQISSDFSLLTHQKLVRDYINLYTPYRGLLLYHGLGSGKTCTSIAIAEGMKHSKKVIIMTPASLQNNYREELKKCGDLLYKRNQYWEWISMDTNPELLKPISAILNLPMEYIRKKKGAFFVNIQKPPNYDSDVLTDEQKKTLEDQLNEMINNKYQFINYNGLNSAKLFKLTKDYTENIFDNAVVVVDEAHNLISRIVNKIKKERQPVSNEETQTSEKDVFGDYTPLNLSTKLYYMLLRATNTKIILLTGTPIINYPNEFAILFNILRGYIKTWEIQLEVNSSETVDKTVLQKMLLPEKSMDYLDYSPASKILTITRNPFGFKNTIKETSGYKGVTNTKKEEFFENVSDAEFERSIIYLLEKDKVKQIKHKKITVINNKALPDDFDIFTSRYIDSSKQLTNVDALKRRIIGLSSYFKSAQENLLPTFTNTLGVDYHIIKINMSDAQFQIYETARQQERKLEKQKKRKPAKVINELYQEQTSTYRIFSRLFCNFIIPERPIPIKDKKKTDKKDAAEKEANSDEEEEDVLMKEKGKKVKKVKKGKKEEEKEEDEEEKEEDEIYKNILREAAKKDDKQDISDDRLGEIEGDEILETIGGQTYKDRLNQSIKNIGDNYEQFLTPEALQTYSPKFLHILENIQREEHRGLHLVYSQFRTAEGIGLFSLVLEKNGFVQFKIKKTEAGLWVLNIAEEDLGKPTFALYTGTETVEEKEYIRRIYNGEWDNVPESISAKLREKSRNNNYGEIIKVLMITSSGSEGINLKNTRYVHIMEPYWHPVRSEQVIGRARRICSHKDLPEEYRTVEVFVYLMQFTKDQLHPKENEPIELKLFDISKQDPKKVITSDEYLYEISQMKANLTNQLTDIIKQSAFDCYIYSNGKCMNFGDPTNDKMSYVPSFLNQQNDATVKANKVAVEWTGKVLTIHGKEYIRREMNKKLLHLYDIESYKAAQKDPSITPLHVANLVKNDQGDWEFISEI